MKGASAIVAIILILMMAVSITGLGYVTFSTFFTKITTSSESAISSTLTTMLAQMKIESITNISDNSKTMIYIRNVGKVDLTNFSAYYNDSYATGTETPGGTANKIAPGEVKSFNITTPTGLVPGTVIKVTTGQGAIAIQSKP